MTVDVIAWPPFQLTGWELADIFPQSKSVGLIEGRSRTSSAQRARRVATANVAGIGTDLDGAGYVRMLNKQWSGKPNLTRVPCLSSLWHLSRAGQDLASSVLTWTDSGTELSWTDDASGMVWGDGVFTLYGEPATDVGYHALTVSGLPPSQIIARPSELISVSTDAATETAFVLKTATSNASGVATIRTDKSAAFTLSGLVSIGHSESVVFEAAGVPRSVQGINSAFGFQWDFREVFEDEYAGGFVELNPWL